MKRIIALMLTVIMVMCMIVSCGGNNDKTTTAGTTVANGTTSGTTASTNKTTGTSATTQATTTTPVPVVPKDESLLIYLDFSFDNLNEDGDVPYFIDMSGNGNHGYLGGAMDVTESANEDMGDALDIKMTGDYLTIKHTDALNFKAEDNYTIEFWFQADTEKLFSQHSWPCLLTKGSPNNTNYFGMWLNANTIYYGTGTYKVTANDNVKAATKIDDKWHHFIAVQKDGAIYTYVDGVAGGTTTAKDVSSTLDFYIGGKVGENDGADVIQQFFGKIDEFKVFNRAFSASEITGVYPVEKDESKLVLDLDFSAITDGVIADKSGKGNNATVTGDVSIVDGAVVFDTDGEYITVKNAATLNFTDTESFIIEYKYKLDAKGGSWPCIFSKGDKGIGWWGMWVNAGIVWGGDTGNKVVTPDMSTDGTWHTIQVVRDASKKAMYVFVDGNLTTQISTALSFVSELDLFIGGNTYAGKGDATTTKVQQFFGTIKEFKIYNYGADALEYADK